MVFKKIIFQNRYVALETGLDPPPFMANAILNFHFDFPHPSLILTPALDTRKHESIEENSFSMKPFGVSFQNNIEKY